MLPFLYIAFGYRCVTNADGTVTQKNHYYPFGTTFAESTNRANQPYKYNGKELDQLHGLNLYDYSARYYESAIGRFTTVDPLAEVHYNYSPYVYVLNNPMKYIDPTGMDTVLITSDGHVEDIFPGGDDVIYHSANAVVVTPNENSESVTATTDIQISIPISYSPKASGRIDGLGLADPIFNILTLGRGWSLNPLKSITTTAAVKSGQQMLSPGAAKLTQKSLEHIIKRHWFTSGAKQAGKFASNTTGKSLKQMIEKATTQGVFRVNTNGRTGTIAEFTFNHVIGTTSSGLSSNTIRVVINTTGEVITAFPI